MNKKKKAHLILNLCIILITGFTFGCLAQRPVNDQGETSKLKVTGKITYVERIGRYFVLGENPATEYMIVNEDSKLLRDLSSSEKVVTLEGSSTLGPDLLFIEKIDGKPYADTKDPIFK